MAIAQDNFDTYRGRGYEGQVSTIDVPEIISGAMQGYVDFGRAVVRASGEERAFAPVAAATTAADVVGFAVRTMASYSTTAPNPAMEYQFGYHDGEHASALRRGRMYVMCLDGATDGSTVHVVVDEASADIGRLRGAASGTAGATIELNQVRWVSDVAAGEIGEIRVDGILNV